MRQKKGLIFVISGPSGSGKTTLLKNLLKTKDLNNRLIKSISFTTRLKRLHEKDGKDYFFLNEKEFKQKLKAQKILEWTRYLGYYYATPKDFVERHLKAGKHILLCLDLKGALKIRQFYPKNTVTIFVRPPSLGALQERIEKRCHKTKKEEIQRRIKLARQELLASRWYDYRLVNKNFIQAARILKGIILDRISNK